MLTLKKMKQRNCIAEKYIKKVKVKILCTDVRKHKWLWTFRLNQTRWKFLKGWTSCVWLWVVPLSRVDALCGFSASSEQNKSLTSCSQTLIFSAGLWSVYVGFTMTGCLVFIVLLGKLIFLHSLHMDVSFYW